MGQFVLICQECGREHPAFRMSCERGCNALLRARYAKTCFEPADAPGLFRFLDWLPCARAVETATGPIVFPAETFGSRLGLRRLYCAFNGYWPERGAFNLTGTFKDFEALPTMIAFAEQGKRQILLASAGNTARAFAYAAQQLDFTVYIVIPEKMLHRMWLPGAPGNGNVQILAVRASSDYSESIRLAAELAHRHGVDSEGGARNVARRDGLGTVLLEAARVCGRLPTRYFQAVGSGTGALGVWEAALRLREDERFRGQPLPRLHLSQNAPFLPLYDAWKNGSQIDPAAYEAPDEPEIYASVLANRTPPYGVRGGVADALTGCGGELYAVDGREAREAGREFREAEGIDLEPAAAVAVASLKQAVAARAVFADDLILLNLTGGGFERLRRDFAIRTIPPSLTIRADRLDEADHLFA